MFLGCVPAHALYFSSFEYSKKVLGADQPGHHPLAAGAAGAVSTVCHDSIMSPMDTIKQRLQLGHYRSLTHCVQSMYKTEGAAAFYRSFGTTLAMNLPYGIVMVSANESFKKVLSPDGRFTLTSSMMAGSAAGALAAAFTCPLDVIKTRLQTQDLSALYPKVTTVTGPVDGGSTSLRMNLHTSGTAPKMGAPGPMCAADPVFSAPKYDSFMSAARSIVREEGANGLFRGLTPRLLTHMPAVAISWTVYEGVKQQFIELID